MKISSITKAPFIVIQRMAGDESEVGDRKQQKDARVVSEQV